MLSKNKDGQEMVQVTKASERAEAVAGVLIAFIAAFMAISELVNNNLEEEMMIAHNMHNNYFSWYQSKSIKESLKESELTTMEAIAKVNDKNGEYIDQIIKIKQDIERYGKEKAEILNGSVKVGKKNWVQDLDGEMGKIIGVKEWEAMADTMDKATQKFDLGMLFFQISLVLGAVCVIIYDNPKLQRAFIVLMLVFGVIGIAYSTYGYILSC